MKILALVFLFGVIQAANATMIVDDFNGALSLGILSGGANPSTISGGNSDASILGGSRGVTFTRTGGGGAENLDIDQGGLGMLLFASGAFDTVTAFLQWDGDTNPNSLNATGLGGVDLTSGGVNTKLVMAQHSDRPTSLGTDFGIIRLIVYSDAGNASQLTLHSINTSFIGPFILLNYDFGSFTPILGAGADFTNVGAIEMFASGSPQAPGLDLAIDFLAATTDIPEPATLVLVGMALVGVGLGRRRIH